MYQVLYRKWRPKIFSDVSGQPQVTVTLKNELKTGRVNHAYLFTGSRGTGKTTCAKIMAKAVNCLNPVDGDPCGKCEMCKGIDDGSIMDIAEIDAASNNGVDNIRTIIDEASFTPTKAKYRVYIIDEVHMLSAGAFNALLKTLEEPPSHIIFILATTEVHKIPATIMSRCQRFDFHRISSFDIAERLKFVAQQENVTLDDDAGLLIASVSDGAMRDSLSLLDRCIGINNHITTEIVHNTAGLAGNNHLFEITDCIINSNTGKVLEIIENLYNNSKDMGRLCEELIGHFRCLILIKTINKVDNLVTFSSQEREVAVKQAKSLTLENMMYITDVLQLSYDRIFKGSNKRTEMELSLIKLTSPKLNTSVQSLLSRISALERTVKRGIKINTNSDISTQRIDNENVTSDIISDKSEISEKNNQENTIKTKYTDNPVSQNISLDYDTIVKNAVLMDDWSEVLKVLKSYSITMATALKNTKAYISGDYILIDSENELAFKRLKQPEERDRMRKAVREVTGRIYKLGPYRKIGQQVEKKDAITEFLNNARDLGVAVEEE